MKHRDSLWAIVGKVTAAAPFVAVLLAIAVPLTLAAALNPDIAIAGTHHRAATAAPALTRGEVVKIVRAQLRLAFALRDWHNYSRLISEYRTKAAASLFTLSSLDRETAFGAPHANVRVIVYADYECPFCKLFEKQTMPALQKHFASKALFIYRFYPLRMHGKLAQTEAVAGVCMAKTAGAKAFNRFTARVFDLTESNGRGTGQSIKALAEYALAGTGQQALLPQFTACTRGKLAPALVAESRTFPGVIGTPTIFMVNLSKHRAWRLAGALPAWVYETMLANVVAGRPGGSDWGVGQFGPPK